MCDFLSSIFGGGDTSAQDAALAAQQAAAKAAKAAADEAATIAAAGASGTDKARKAAERKLRSMQEAGGFAFGFGDTPPAQVGYRTATGA